MIEGRMCFRIKEGEVLNTTIRSAVVINNFIIFFTMVNVHQLLLLRA
jgi:hypothetical protein